MEVVSIQRKVQNQYRSVLLRINSEFLVDLHSVVTCFWGDVFKICHSCHFFLLLI